MFLIYTASQAQIINQDGSQSSRHHEHWVKWGRKSRKTKRVPLLAERAPSKHPVSHKFLPLLSHGQECSHMATPSCRRCGEAWSLFWEAVAPVLSLRQKSGYLPSPTSRASSSAMTRPTISHGLGFLLGSVSLAAWVWKKINICLTWT